MKKLTISILALFLFLTVTAFAQSAVNVALYSPSNDTWIRTNVSNWNFTVTGNYTSYNCTISNTTANVNSTTPANNTNMIMNVSGTLNDNSTGYKFSFSCANTTGGFRQYNVTNITIKVDETAPAAFTCTDVNNTRASDFSPNINWTVSNDATSGFLRYLLRIRNGSDVAGTSHSEYNVTSNGTLFREATLSSGYDQVYNWYISSYDVAGNERNATNCVSPAPFTYTTDTTCANLTAGWNACGALRDGINASNICTEAGCNFVSKYSAVNHTYETYTNGSALYAGMTFLKGEAIWVYVNTSTNWNGVDPTDYAPNLSLIGARRWNLTDTSIRVSSISNGTLANSSLWNIICQQNRTLVNFSEFGRKINKSLSDVPGNITGNLKANGTAPFFSAVNTSSGKYIPKVWNFTINDGHRIDYGECVWVYLNDRSVEKVNITW